MRRGGRPPRAGLAAPNLRWPPQRCNTPCSPQVLLEVAASVQHLHNMQLLHCDIKPENVLLKSDNSNPLGFTTKLSDFGLAKLLRDNYYIINRSGSGTVTHLAPELFQVRPGWAALAHPGG